MKKTTLLVAIIQSITLSLPVYCFSFNKCVDEKTGKTFYNNTICDTEKETTYYATKNEAWPDLKLDLELKNKKIVEILFLISKITSRNIFISNDFNQKIFFNINLNNESPRPIMERLKFLHGYKEKNFYNLLLITKTENKNFEHTEYFKKKCTSNFEVLVTSLDQMIEWAKENCNFEIQNQTNINHNFSIRGNNIEMNDILNSIAYAYNLKLVLNNGTILVVSQ